MESKPAVTFEDFAKLDLRVGTIEVAEEVENSEKLLRMEISLGEEKRQIVAGLKKDYSPESLIGKQVVIVANLEPKKLAGVESQGMILVADGGDEGFSLYSFDKKIPDGNRIS